ncbi:hypothetical protein [Ramlibacter tataouinensis]|uniref:Uncharacterized protein n=1 Tax=Ramlibacter tataouinensis (strain ATCC BAA-407 / DSM 14655 / LMG 21543 / TTB310) TaxID=365046 RepID=F5Y106_RAMTT|nr:hypothetical protein [Ramlibacter tataouinensis]AEG92224.1 hypothetical protein Rta_11390 [Ramlibacter tataouinensis TTB310]
MKTCLSAAFEPYDTPSWSERLDLPANTGPARPAVRAILSRYAASKWEMADGRARLGDEGPAADGEFLRAIPDSGFGASLGHPMQMLNWLDPQRAAARAPVARTLEGRRCSDHTASGTWGFWCKKAAMSPGVLPHPGNRVPYHLQDAHFALIALSVPCAEASGVAFQASKAEETHVSELRLAGGCPQARWVDAKGQQVVLTGEARLPLQRPVVLALTSRPGRQTLRFNGVEMASASARFSPSLFGQLLIGWGFTRYFPVDGFGGHVFAAIAGKGAIEEDELSALEAHLADLAGAAG